MSGSGEPGNLASQSQADVCSVTKSDHGASIDFTDARALRALTAALLRHDFNLDIELRDDRLCPTVGCLLSTHR